MDRRDTIKSILLGGVAGGLVLNGCKTDDSKLDKKDAAAGNELEAGGGYGRILFYRQMKFQVLLPMHKYQHS